MPSDLDVQSHTHQVEPIHAGAHAPRSLGELPTDLPPHWVTPTLVVGPWAEGPGAAADCIA